MPELATLTGARAGHTNGWHGPTQDPGSGWGWQALIDCRFRRTWGLAGAAVVNFWAGKLCFLSLNVVVFFVRFLVGSCEVCCALFCGQIIREVVHFLCSFCMGSCAFDICYLFQKHDREHKKKHEDKQGFSLSKIISLAKFVSDQNFSLKKLSLSKNFP